MIFRSSKITQSANYWIDVIIYESTTSETICIILYESAITKRASFTKLFDPTWVLHKTYLITCKLPQYPSEKNVNKSNKISYFNNSIEWLRKNCKSDQEKILKWIALCDDICSKMDMIAKEIIEFSCKWNLCPWLDHNDRNYH